VPITKIISGGQTGADRGGLEAAIYCDVPHSGWCPKGRLAADGTIPDRYDLQEMPTTDYRKRTEANVVDSDATVIFTYGSPTRGNLSTIKFARKHEKPYEHIDLLDMSKERAVKTLVDWLNGEGENDDDDYQAVPPKEHIDLLDMSKERAVKTLVEWLNGEGENDYEDYEAVPPKECILNVAGSRESKAPGIGLLVKQIMASVLRCVNPE